MLQQMLFQSNGILPYSTTDETAGVFHEKSPRVHFLFHCAGPQIKASQAQFTQDAEADLHPNLHPNHLMLLVSCMNTPIDCVDLSYCLHVAVCSASASCVNGV